SARPGGRSGCSSSPSRCCCRPSAAWAGWRSASPSPPPTRASKAGRRSCRCGRRPAAWPPLSSSAVSRASTRPCGPPACPRPRPSPSRDIRFVRVRTPFVCVRTPDSYKSWGSCAFVRPIRTRTGPRGAGSVPHMDTLRRAERYLLSHARLLDRLRFAALFAGGSRERVLDALRCYQNPDGGFGHALEPDLRGAASQPEPVEVAFWILDELDAFGDPMVHAACDYLASITTPDGGVPFCLPSVRETPRAPWWETPDDPPGNLIPTASIAGLLHAHGVDHPWRGPATDFCWRTIAAVEKTTPYEARAIVTFLSLVDDRERAEAEF